MPAKPLNQEQLEDAHRLRSAYAFAKAATGLTQEQLAAMCGWKTQAAVSQYLLGKIPLNLDALFKFSKALNVLPESISPRLAGKPPQHVGKTYRIAQQNAPYLAQVEPVYDLEFVYHVLDRIDQTVLMAGLFLKAGTRSKLLAFFLQYFNDKRSITDRQILDAINLITPDGVVAKDATS